MVGIYKIASPTERVYIGQSYNIKSRIWSYEKEKCNTQPKLYNSIKKHGWDAHKFEVVMELREDIKPECLTYWEQFFMNYYRGEGYDLLNLKEAGSKGKASDELKQKLRDAWKRSPKRGRGKNHPNFGKKASAATRKKLSDSHIGINTGNKNSMYGKKHSEETKKAWSIKRKGKNVGVDNWRSIPINQYDLNGTFIKEWESMGMAGRTLKIHSIWACCKGRTRHAGGFIWRYKNES
jgi:group I intron endonuclease